GETLQISAPDQPDQILLRQGFAGELFCSSSELVVRISDGRLLAWPFDRDSKPRDIATVGTEAGPLTLSPDRRVISFAKPRESGGSDLVAIEISTGKEVWRITRRDGPRLNTVLFVPVHNVAIASADSECVLIDT